MVILIAYIFLFAIYVDATSTSLEIHNASIAFVDKDWSSLSIRVIDAFYPPRFVDFAQAVLYRGLGIDVVWLDMLWIFIIGMVFFLLTLIIFRKSLESE